MLFQYAVPVRNPRSFSTRMNPLSRQKILNDNTTTPLMPSTGSKPIPAGPITKVCDQSSVDRSKSQSIRPLPVTTSFGGITSQQTITLTNNEKSTSPTQRLHYDRHELLRIRDSLGPFPIPKNLPDLDIVITRRDDNNEKSNHAGKQKQEFINPACDRKLSSINHPPLTSSPNDFNAVADSKHTTGNYRSSELDFDNRVQNQYTPVDQSKADANDKLLRYIKTKLNNMTQKTFDITLHKLDVLEINCYEVLDGMVTLIYSKAVDEPGLSDLYAKLCKKFQKKQVTVRGDDGKLITYCFRQILFTKCHKEFESDYREEIEYEKRKAEIDSLTDDKKRKEEGEKLEDDLVKAKQRKLECIFFLGELFKLQMLTETIMYDCIKYLLSDESDEESIECLCCLLRTIGKELDDKALEKTENKTSLEKYYHELNIIVKEQKTSANICCMIQDLIDLRQFRSRFDLLRTNRIDRNYSALQFEFGIWPTTIDEIHVRERYQDQSLATMFGTPYSGGKQKPYNDERGIRDSDINQQSDRNNDERVENRFSVNSIRELQSNDKRNQGPFAMSLASQRTSTKVSGIERKPEEDCSFGARTGKPPASPIQQLKGKVGSSQGVSTYSMQRQLSRENSHRDRENALQSLRKATTGSEVNTLANVAGTTSIRNYRED
ncbi:unnamed protein product [Rotaria magnacalcarata]|uniref:MIF4G domain-containing protein n=2 Tax=Rotaria magnacalcarata TaxID=392030 RepID=A0A816SK99_9BILA|nr:unnamed protein product [Rotaria magnacalcarata]